MYICSLDRAKYVNKKVNKSYVKYKIKYQVYQCKCMNNLEKPIYYKYFYV